MVAIKLLIVQEALRRLLKLKKNNLPHSKKQVMTKIEGEMSKKTVRG